LTCKHRDNKKKVGATGKTRATNNTIFQLKDADKQRLATWHCLKELEGLKLRYLLQYQLRAKREMITVDTT